MGVKFDFDLRKLLEIIKDNGGKIEVDLLDAKFAAAGWWNSLMVKPIKVALDAVNDGYLEVARDEKRNQILVLTEKAKKEWRL